MVYQALYGDYKIYARSYEMFASKAGHEKYPDVQQNIDLSWQRMGNKAEEVWWVIGDFLRLFQNSVKN